MGLQSQEFDDFFRVHRDILPRKSRHRLINLVEKTPIGYSDERRLGIIVLQNAARPITPNITGRKTPWQFLSGEPRMPGRASDEAINI
jgi:hypothetical protein